MAVGGTLPAALFDKCAGVDGVFSMIGLGLTGPIPASIGKLTQATVILMYGNKLEGAIPDEIGRCVKVKELVLL